MSGFGNAGVVPSGMAPAPSSSGAANKKLINQHPTKGPLTPLSLASTPPMSPNFAPLGKSIEGVHPRFVRTTSVTSTEAPESPLHGFTRCLSEESMGSVPTISQCPITSMMSMGALDENDDDEQTGQYVDEDGMSWVEISGTGATRQREEYSARMERLENSLSEVKGLYKKKTGISVDTEIMYGVDADGMSWVGIEGQGAVAQKDSYMDRVGGLLDKLDMVKDMFEQQYGYSVDDVDDSETPCVDADGTQWIETRGTGVLQQRETYYSRMDRLEQSLAEVKDLYKKKTGRRVDSDKTIQYDADGMMWEVTEGSGAPLQRAAYNQRVESLEDSLAQVKRMFHRKHGYSVDEESPPTKSASTTSAPRTNDLGQKVDEDGMPYVEIVGTGAPRQRADYQTRMERLEASLSEVKGLYQKKTGKSVDAETFYGMDSEGTSWVGIEGQGAEVQKDQYNSRLDRLLAKLDDVKDSFEDQYGYSVDDYDASEPSFVDADGTPWIETKGTGSLPQRDAYFDRMERLEQSLTEVKDLYKKKTGVDVDSDKTIQYDSDGTMWEVVTGQGPRLQRAAYMDRVEGLEDSLAEVKKLFERKYGYSVDDEEDQTTKLESIGCPPMQSQLGVWAECVVHAGEWLEQEQAQKGGNCTLS